MVIGILIGEAVDLLWTLGRLSYNSVIWIYQWYYNTTPEEKKKLELQTLEERIAHLETLVKES